MSHEYIWCFQSNQFQLAPVPQSKLLAIDAVIYPETNTIGIDQSNRRFLQIHRWPVGIVHRQEKSYRMHRVNRPLSAITLPIGLHHVSKQIEKASKFHETLIKFMIKVDGMIDENKFCWKNKIRNCFDLNHQHCATHIDLKNLITNSCRNLLKKLSEDTSYQTPWKQNHKYRLPNIWKIVHKSEINATISVHNYWLSFEN